MVCSFSPSPHGKAIYAPNSWAAVKNVPFAMTAREAIIEVTQLMRIHKAFLLFALLLMSCGRQDPSLLALQLRLITLQERAPVKWVASATLPAPWSEQRLTFEAYGFKAYAQLGYALGSGDTVQVTILEFQDDMSALSFQLNGGYTREGLPVVKGEIQERSIRAGRRVFLFTSGIYRPLAADVAEKFVKVFPGFRAGLPQEFLALPIKNREAGGTSMQMGSFLGAPTSFAMLVQRYGDESGHWQCARSWTRVSAGDWEHYLNELAKRAVVKTGAVGKVACDVMACAWLDRLPDGRVVAAYGDVDLERLTSIFMVAKYSVRDSGK